MENNDPSLFSPSALAQLRALLQDLRLVSAQLLPPALREADPVQDRRAARLDRVFFRLLRLVNDLTLATRLSAPLPLFDADIAGLAGDICRRADGLARLSGLHLRFLCGAEHHRCALAPAATEALLYHLLSDAMRRSAPGSTVTVELRFTAGVARLSVERTDGREAPLPFPPEAPWRQELCRRLAACQGGVLVTASRRGEGLRSVFSLPDRQCGSAAAEDPPDLSGGWNPTLIALADALPAEAFLLRSQG